ncbi:MAG: VCBS repeat-containing protein, partial [Bacteroidales bacterium]|nr:VCBS repeat-containing protein [Bacteroidales bacterium]
MKKLIYYIILNIIINSYSVFCQFPEFRYSVIGSTDELSGQTSLVDVDKDGDLDWIVGTADTIWWFEYQGADHWIKHILGLAPATETGGIALDVDGDGFVDQVSGGTWYKNSGDPGKMWTKFSSKAIPAHECISADINNDGKPDVVMMNDTKGIY